MPRTSSAGLRRKRSSVRRFLPLELLERREYLAADAFCGLMPPRDPLDFDDHHHELANCHHDDDHHDDDHDHHHDGDGPELHALTVLPVDGVDPSGNDVAVKGQSRLDSLS